jgi:hypothetical protein
MPPVPLRTPSYLWLIPAQLVWAGVHAVADSTPQGSILGKAADATKAAAAAVVDTVKGTAAGIVGGLRLGTQWFPEGSKRSCDLYWTAP